MIDHVPKVLINALLMFQNFLLVTHHKPDGDAVGSVIAMGKMLKKMGKHVDYCVQMPLEDKLKIFREIKCFNHALKPHYDALIYLDCSTASFAHMPENAVNADQVLVIDHHRSNEGYGDINFIEETAAAGELVFRVMKALAIEPDEEMVDALFTALSTDTGSFQFSNVTADTHQIVSELYQYKDNFAALSRRLHHEKSFAQMKMYGAAVETLTMLDGGRIAWVQLPYETITQYGGDVNITDDIANIGMNVAGSVLSVTVKETEKAVYRVSLRSKTPSPIDVSIPARKYNGGGHMRAAGFTYKGDLTALQAELIAFAAHQEAEHAC